MNDVLARPPVSVSAPVVAREKPNARPASQKKPQPNPEHQPGHQGGQDQAGSKFQAVHVGQGQGGKRNVNDEPIQHRGRIVRQPPRTAQEDAEKKAGHEEQVVVHRPSPPQGS